MSLIWFLHTAILLLMSVNVLLLVLYEYSTLPSSFLISAIFLLTSSLKTKASLFLLYCSILCSINLTWSSNLGNICLDTFNESINLICLSFNVFLVFNIPNNFTFASCDQSSSEILDSAESSFIFISDASV